MRPKSALYGLAFATRVRPLIIDYLARNSLSLSALCLL